MIRRRHHVSRRAAVSVVLAAALSTAPVFSIPADAATQYVALVVQSGPNVKPVTNCVPWVKGMTGFDVLRKADHDIVWQAGTYQLVQIDLVPSSATADATHYWSYLHRAAAQPWARSTTNGAAYQPQPGTVEGWLYVNGKAYTAPDVSFASICSKGTPPTPTVRASSSAATPSSAAPRTSPARTTTVQASPSKPTAKPSAHPRTSGRPATQPAASAPRSAPATATAAHHPPATASVLWVAFGGLLAALATAAATVALVNRRSRGGST